MDQGRLKGKDFCALLPYLESSREETMAFGDGNNDAPINIRDAGIGVVMENGDPDLKGLPTI